MVSSTPTTVLAAIALAASTSAPSVNAFVTPVVSNNNIRRPLCAAATDDASAQALSDYMAKSHEEKLRAVKDVEDKKNAEIEALKAEIADLKTSSALATTTAAALASSAAPLATADVAAMEAKLASYQDFMAEYIVNAQNQKLLAVKEAELKAEKKFQDRLEKLLEASGMALPADAAPAAPVAVEETLYQKRNAQIIAAGAAGKSRWGAKEIERAVEEAKSSPAPVATAASSGATAETSSVFEQRNAQVVAAAGAGKSRWGDMEVQRAANGATVAVVVEEEKPKAPISLEDRVNLGAQLLGA